MAFEAPKEEREKVTSLFGRSISEEAGRELIELLASWITRIGIICLVTSFLVGGTIGYWVSYILWK